MPLKTYGIFTAYPPGTEFRYEGLGRYLASFVRSGTRDPDVRFVIACPSWSRQAIRELLTEAGVAKDLYSLLGPEKQPLSISLYQWWLRVMASRKRGPIQRPTNRLVALASDHVVWLMRRLSTTRNPVIFVAIGTYLSLLGLIAAPLLLVGVAISAVAGYSADRWGRARPRLALSARRATDRLRSLLRIPAEVEMRSWAFQIAQRNEIEAIVARIKGHRSVSAWYCPTAIWPAITDIGRPALICVPDVVLSEFPVAFSQIGGAPMEQTYDGILQTLDRGGAFVTYSEQTKWGMLVERFGVKPDLISVIPHAANRLDHLIEVSNFSDPGKASESYCRTLVESGLQKAYGAYPRDFHGTNFRFLFYASQIRPSKNVLTLLRAFRYLVKEQYLGRKLVLTGNPATMPTLMDHVAELGLLNDVIFLPGLTDAELAAFYRLADLAVNPSLSEGGMPFTFTEAVSVGTPVVMSDIAVTREVLTDDALCAETLFDGHDWQAVATRIEAVLADRDGLAGRQRAFFDEHLARRSWQDVVREHLARMDALAATADAKGTATDD